MRLIHGPQCIEKYPPVWIIIIHLYLLSYYSLFLFHIFISKMRSLYIAYEIFQRRDEIICSRKIICSYVKIGICVWRCSKSCKCIKYIAFIRHFKHLVFKKMRYTVIYSHIFLSMRIDIFKIIWSEISSKNRIFFRKSLFGHNKNLHIVMQFFIVYFLI